MYENIYDNSLIQFNSTINSKVNFGNNNNYIKNYTSKAPINYKKIINRIKNISFISDNYENKEDYNFKCIIDEVNKNKYFKEKMKLKQIPKKFINQGTLVNFHKSNTQNNFFNQNSLYNTQNNFKNLTNISALNSLNINNNDKKLNNTNSFFVKKPQRGIRNKIIYFNSSLNDFYDKNNKNNSNLSFKGINNYKHSYLPKSYSVGLINDIISSYNKNNKNKSVIIKDVNNNDHKKNNTKNDTKSEDINKKMFKGFTFLPMNKSLLKTLFKKTPIKIKSGVLTSIPNNKFKSDIFLNPFSNSYGPVLDNLSERIGFMKGSINMIYPKIAQTKYQIKTYERINEYKDIVKKRKMKKSWRNKSVDNKKIVPGNKNMLYSMAEPKKIIQFFPTKYPVKIINNGNNLISSKMYSLRRQKNFFVNEL